jgi:ankyrin repeat protein
MIRVCIVIFAVNLGITATCCLARAQTPIDVAVARQHRLSPLGVIHTDGEPGLSHARIWLQITVGTDGTVESARAMYGPKELKGFFAEAETIGRSQRYKPFEEGGVPVRAVFMEDVYLAPPEQWAAQRIPVPKIKDWASLRMTLFRGMCFPNSCPSYSVEVRGDGAVTYHGETVVFIGGEHRGWISREQVEQLVAKFRQADFFSLRDEYRVSGIYHGPTATTSIEFDGLKKQVKHAAGLWVGMPGVVSELEKAFDELAGTEKWIRETSETLPSLLAEDWDFGAETDENAELFGYAVANGSKGLIEQFLNAGAPVWATTKGSLGEYSPLENAAARADIDLVRRMLDQEDDIPPVVLFQALRAAAESGDLGLVRLLIEHGADVNGSPANEYHSGTALMAAVQSGKGDVVDEILLHHPHVNAKNFGRTALFFLERDGGPGDAEHIVKALISHGSRLDQVDHQGRTPLFAACTAPKAIKALVAAGADVNARDHFGETPLMNCSDSKDAVEALLEAGADPSLQDHDGATAARHARAYKDSKETVDLLDAAVKKKASQ